MKAVLDTNVVLQMLSVKSRYNPILQSFISGGFTWVLTLDIYLEYTEIVQQRGGHNAAYLLQRLLFQSRDVADTKVFFFFFAIESDPNDNKFVDAYLAGQSDYLVTWDRHFDELKKDGFPTVHVINPDEFLQRLGINFTKS